MMTTSYSHAIVIGASMGGLLVARVLADHFDQVTIIERDTLPTEIAPRKGVPQGQHPHVLLSRGRLVFERFFPGITADLIERGAVAADTDTISIHRDGGYMLPIAIGETVLSMTRPFLEGVVREHLTRLSRLRIIDACDALGLRTNESATRVTGLRIIRRQPGAAEELLAADLVVDATGRGSRSPAWLQGLGFDPPAEDRMRIDLTYTTRLYRRAPTTDNVLTRLIEPTPENTRGGGLIAIEGNRWIAAVTTYLGDAAPRDDVGFRAAMRELTVPDIADVLDHAEPLSDGVTYRFAVSQRRWYERLDRFPNGFLVFGDAICGFNPVYGQGMTVSALQAEVLDACLSAGRSDLARRFFRHVSPVINIPWDTVVGGDLRFPHIVGERTRSVRFGNWYFDKVVKAAHHDSQVTKAIYGVIGLVNPPSSLLRSRTLARVIRGNLWPHARQGATPSERFRPAPS